VLIGQLIQTKNFFNGIDFFFSRSNIGSMLHLLHELFLGNESYDKSGMNLELSARFLSISILPKLAQAVVHRLDWI
jgi:hypothetical protein